MGRGKAATGLREGGERDAKGRGKGVKGTSKGRYVHRVFANCLAENVPFYS